MNRLNPFAFPSYHTALFAILVVTVVSPAISVGVLYVKLVPLATSTIGKVTFLSFPLLTLAGLTLLTLFFYLYDPRRKIRKQRLERIESRCPELSSFVGQLSEEIGVHPPIVLWSDATDYQAEIFGNHRETYLRISDGLCSMFYANREFVGSIFLHELSHLKNRDLTKHTVAEKMIRSYLILLIAHAVLFLAIRPFVSEFFFEAHSFWLRELYLVPTLAMYLVNGQLLRVREFYADARVASVQKTTKKLISTLQLFVAKRTRLEKIKGAPPAIERINILRDNSRLFVPKIEYGLALGLLLAFFRTGVSVSMISFSFAQDVSFLPETALLTIGFTLFSLMFLPFFFIMATKGLKSILQLLKFFAGVAIGFLGYQIYAVRAITDLVVLSALNTVLMISLMALALLLAFVMTMGLFARQPFSKNAKFLLVELTLIAFFISAVITPDLLFISLIGLGVVLLALFRRRILGKCPRCGALLKDTVAIFRCPSCSHEMNQWLFDNVS